jgi:hypothetical protein
MKVGLAEQYANLERWHWWFRGRERILATVLRREFDAVAHPTVASVGCGPPEGLAWLEPIVGPSGRVVGVDADTLHACPLRPGIRYIVGKLEAAPLAPLSPREWSRGGPVPTPG